MFFHRNQINFAFLQAISIDVSRKKKTKALEVSTLERWINTLRKPDQA